MVYLLGFLGFTRKESGVIIFLVLSFLAGLALKTYRQKWEPLPKISDDVFMNKPGTEKDSLDNGIYSEIKTAFLSEIILNKASSKDLERIPGIGPVMSARIISYRTLKGPFRNLDDLKKVKGIGQKKLEKIKSFIKLN